MKYCLPELTYNQFHILHNIKNLNIKNEKNNLEVANHILNIIWIILYFLYYIKYIHCNYQNRMTNNFLLKPCMNEMFISFEKDVHSKNNIHLLMIFNKIMNQIILSFYKHWSSNLLNYLKNNYIKYYLKWPRILVLFFLCLVYHIFLINLSNHINLLILNFYKYN